VLTGQTGHFQKTITITAPRRGCHLITSEILRQLPELRRFRCGTAHIFIKHTSASLSINENADPDVRVDLEAALNKIVPEAWHRELFTHVLEGPDDMAGHVKSSLLGASVTLPIANGRFDLGTWQGVYLCEHRDSGGYGGGHARNITITLQGLLSE
ncbi:unnamed protein product, partial [Chrysoparadoxa australica]